MSFLTEYFDNFRDHPIRKTATFNPERRYVKIPRKWLDPKTGKDDKVLTDEEIKDFIRKTMKELRGQSEYYNGYCAHLSQEFKTREFVPKPTKNQICKRISGAPKQKSEEEIQVLPKGLALKDTEVMKKAGEMYGRDMNQPSLEPLNTTPRIYGYVRPSLYRTGLSEYMESFARLAYETVRDNRIPKFYAHNGNRPRWGYPPDGIRQPELDGVPFDGESLI